MNEFPYVSILVFESWKYREKNRKEKNLGKRKTGKRWYRDDRKGGVSVVGEQASWRERERVTERGVSVSLHMFPMSRPVCVFGYGLAHRSGIEISRNL